MAESVARVMWLYVGYNLGKVGEHLEAGLKGHMSMENAGKHIGEAVFDAFNAKVEHHHFAGNPARSWWSFVTGSK